MCRLPLTSLYCYDETTMLYRRFGTHHTITIQEYEALEKQREKELTSLARITFATVLISFVAVVAIVASL